MGYRRLTLKQRYQIQVYLDSCLSSREVARELGVSPSTISNERAKCGGVYNAEVAQEVTRQRNLKRRFGRYKIKGSLRVDVKAKLKKKWSPEQIAGRLKFEDSDSISH